MARTKWMRLAVKDPRTSCAGAGAQDTRRLDDHRVIHGREFVSFRPVPRYRVEIGTTDSVVLVNVTATMPQRMTAAIAGLRGRPPAGCRHGHCGRG